jgi:mannose-6-phosphate isomerase class I
VEGNTFPLLTKILDANNDLSVQVHPNDEYANEHENGELGKTECWYIIDCKEGADMIYGHNAASKEELIQMVNSGEWNSHSCAVSKLSLVISSMCQAGRFTLYVRVHLCLKHS